MKSLANSSIPGRPVTQITVGACVAFTIAACATTALTNDNLEHARVSVSAAQQNPQITGEAASDLRTAEQALKSGDEMLQAGKPAAEVDHEAYLAERFALAAQKGAELRVSEKEIADAESRRNTVLLAARERETTRANDLAQSKSAEADASRQRAEQLERALSDMQAKQTERGPVITLGDVLFSTNQADLKPGARRSLDKLVNFMRQYPKSSVQIEGFTDSVGADDYNQRLSEHRADAVRGALTEQGIASDRIRTRGFGKGSPVADNDSASGRQQNRRVEVIISEGDERTATRSQ